MAGDQSIRLRRSCKYSNEPSSVDGVSDNGSIFYLPLLVCDSRIYLVDGPKSARFSRRKPPSHTHRRFTHSPVCHFNSYFYGGAVLIELLLPHNNSRPSESITKRTLPETSPNRLTNQPKPRRKGGCGGETSR